MCEIVTDGYDDCVYMCDDDDAGDAGNAGCANDVVCDDNDEGTHWRIPWAYMLLRILIWTVQKVQESMMFMVRWME